MKYIVIIFILLPNIYLFSFAKYEYKNSKLSAIGSAILAIISLALPTILILKR